MATREGNRKRPARAANGRFAKSPEGSRTANGEAEEVKKENGKADASPAARFRRRPREKTPEKIPIPGLDGVLIFQSPQTGGATRYIVKPMFD